jgi:DHA1 family solute carrier family 18 vesicular amine transporter 1/2
MNAALQFFILQPHVNRSEPEGSSIRTLVKDPYIIVAVGAITIGNLGIAMLEPSLPIHMMDTMQSNSFERGRPLVTEQSRVCRCGLPAGQHIVSDWHEHLRLIGVAHWPLVVQSHWIIDNRLFVDAGIWFSVLFGRMLAAQIPLAGSLGGLIIPNACMGFAIGRPWWNCTAHRGAGMIDASMFPEMGRLVDLRHSNAYGTIYAISDSAFCFAFALGARALTPQRVTLYVLQGRSLVDHSFKCFHSDRKSYLCQGYKMLAACWS